MRSGHVGSDHSDRTEHGQDQNVTDRAEPESREPVTTTAAHNQEPRPGRRCDQGVHPDNDPRAPMLLPCGHRDDGIVGVCGDLSGMGADDIVPKPAGGMRAHDEELRTDGPIGRRSDGRALEDRRVEREVRRRGCV